MESKIFDDYEVDCNTCEEYWTSKCDGVKIGDKRNCKCYVATRDINAIHEIAKLKTRVTTLFYTVLVTQLVVLIHLIGVIVSND